MALGINDLTPIQEVTVDTKFEGVVAAADPQGRLGRKATGKQIEVFMNRAGGDIEVKIDAKVEEETDRAKNTEGSLLNLNTETKANLVAAVNEVSGVADEAFEDGKAALGELPKKANKIITPQTKTLAQADVGDTLGLVTFDTSSVPSPPQAGGSIVFADGSRLDLSASGDMTYTDAASAVTDLITGGTWKVAEIDTGSAAVLSENNANSGAWLSGTWVYGEVSTDLSDVKQIADQSLANANAAAATAAQAQVDINTHKSNKTNPHEVTKVQVGLGNVDNTSDIDKPVSTAQGAAIAGISKFKNLEAARSLYLMGNEADGGYIEGITYYDETKEHVKTHGAFAVNGQYPQYYYKTYAYVCADIAERDALTGVDWALSIDGGADGENALYNWIDTEWVFIENRPGHDEENSRVTRYVEELHDGGTYYSTALTGFNWTKSPDKAYVDGAVAGEAAARDAAIAAAKLAIDKWLPAVDTKAQLADPATLDRTFNYLCRVIADPTPENIGVWQLIADADEWTYFSNNTDFVDEVELATAISQEAANRTAAISTAISNEASDRDLAISGAIAGEVTNRNSAIDAAVETTLTDEAASDALPPTTKTGFAALFQSVRNFLKHVKENALFKSATVGFVKNDGAIGYPVKADVGLADVDNTSDEDKPLSLAARTALDDKLDIYSDYTPDWEKFNSESDGGGHWHYSQSPKALNFIGANKQSAATDPSVELYSIDGGGSGGVISGGTRKGTRLMMVGDPASDSRLVYTKGNATSAWTADNEVLTRGDVPADSGQYTYANGYGTISGTNPVGISIRLGNVAARFYSGSVTFRAVNAAKTIKFDYMIYRDTAGWLYPIITKIYNDYQSTDIFFYMHTDGYVYLYIPYTSAGGQHTSIKATCRCTQNGSGYTGQVEYLLPAYRWEIATPTPTDKSNNYTIGSQNWVDMNYVLSAGVTVNGSITIKKNDLLNKLIIRLYGVVISQYTYEMTILTLQGYTGTQNMYVAAGEADLTGQGGRYPMNFGITTAGAVRCTILHPTHYTGRDTLFDNCILYGSVETSIL